MGRLRNALHKSRPELKGLCSRREAKTLTGASTLSDLKAALVMTRDEWDELLEKFFNLGGN